MDSQTKTELQSANEGCIAMLIEMARSDREPPFALVRSLAPRLLELDAVAREKAGDRPYLLLDFRFQDGPWWQAHLEGRGETSEGPWASCFPRMAAVELARRSLTLAWHTAGTRLAEFSVSLGISREVTSVLCRMKLEELERLAELRIDVMRPRWVNRLSLWRRLLDAAKSGDVQALNFVDRLSAQLLATDLLKSRSIRRE
jgi:hypothetical protein